VPYLHTTMKIGQPEVGMFYIRMMSVSKII